MPRFPFLLDDSRLEGAHAVERVVGPERVAAAVDRADLADAHAAIRELCMTWGGVCGALLPAERGARDLNARWQRFLDDGAFDQFATREVVAEDKDHTRRRGVFELGFVRGEPLLAILWGRHDRDDWAIVDCSLPSLDDPWFVAYLGCYGAWPEAPPEHQLKRSGLVSSYRLEQLLPTERGVIEDPGPVDLIARMRRPGHQTPAQMSRHGLALWRLPEASHMSEAPALPMEHFERGRYGPNLVVVYEPGSVEDLALLWNLRGAHAAHPSVPLAVPVTDDPARALRIWSSHPSESWALRLFGLVSHPWGIVSASVGPDDLAQIAADAGGLWRATEADLVLKPAARPGRQGSDVALFHDGIAQVAALNGEDREFLRTRPSQAHSPELRATLRPKDERLPETRIFRRFLPTLWGYRGGGQEFDVGKLDSIVQLDWPSGWNLLDALVRDHDLQPRPSRPGRAATAFLQRLGLLAELEPLVDTEVLDAVSALGVRSGRAWFEQKVRELHDALGLAPDDAVERSRAIECELSELQLEPFEADRAELTRDGLKQRLTRAAADEWLGWAESRELLVRGAEIRCPRCHARRWRPAAELAPPIVCSGCARPIPRPFSADRLVFRYRASEMLRQVLQQNALPHVLALRWFAALLKRRGLVGAHPGVDFYDDDQRRVGEADVVLVMPDGGLALGECKRTPYGLLEPDVERLETLADRLCAAWTFYAVPAWADELTDAWKGLRRDVPERPRFVLTNEQLLQPGAEIRWALGETPFDPKPLNTAERRDRHDGFVKRVADAIAWVERPRHADEMLLNEA